MAENKNGAFYDDIISFAAEKLNTEPDFPWIKYPDYAVLRHKDNKKWFALIFDVSKDKLGLDGSDKVRLLNLKCDPIMYGSIISVDGILPAYHMKKGSWITLLLDGTVDRELVYSLIETSYDLTRLKIKRKNIKNDK